MLLMHLLLAIVLMTGCKGEEYIVPAITDGWFYAVSGTTGGKWKIQSLIPPFSTQELQTANREVLLVRLLDPGLHIKGYVYNSEYHPLPVSGNRYIFMSCPITPSDKRMGFMVVSHKKQTDVEITFKLEGNVTHNGKTYSNGDTLIISLKEYDTVSVYSLFDLTGTTLSSSGPPITVFSLMEHKNYRRSIVQLLPVHLFRREYVVSTNGTTHELQIVSDYNNTVIVFNNGSSINVSERHAHRQTVRPNENLFFNSTKPVMPLLCVGGSYFTFVLPVSLYKEEAILPQTTGNESIFILTEKSNTDFRLSVPVTWTDIPFSRFKVGKLSHLQSSSSVASNNSFAILVYGNKACESGFDFASALSLELSTDLTFMIPAEYFTNIYVTSGENGGYWEQESELPGLSFAGRKFRSDSVTKLNGSGINLYWVSSFAAHFVLPVNDLGTKYIVSSCIPPGGFASVLVIASQNKTFINITFRLDGNITIDNETFGNGDTFTLNSEKYRSFTIRSMYDLSGTILSSNTTSFAVFSGSIYQDQIYGLEQLIPVKYHGQEYAVAVDNRFAMYHMQIISEDINTKIIFNNGSVKYLDKRGLYSHYLDQEESLSFNTTRPVMTTLCHDNAFVVVPPAESYVQETSLIIPYQSSLVVIKILIEDYSEDQPVNQSIVLVPEMPIEWIPIPSSKYIVGTAKSRAFGRNLFISSAYRFNIIAFNFMDALSGGYNFTRESSPENVGDKDIPDEGGIPTVVVIVAAGTGVCVTSAMIYGGYQLFRRRRRRRRREDEREKKEEQREFDSKDGPSHPLPGGPPPLARS